MGGGGGTGRDELSAYHTRERARGDPTAYIYVKTIIQKDYAGTADGMIECMTDILVILHRNK